MKITFSDGILTAFVQGEIDHHSAVGIRTEIDRRIQKDKPDILRLDYSNVTFMDSSGIGLIMGRYKLMSAYSGQIEVVNVPLNMARVVRLSGIEKLGKITVKES
ncbi:MAG: anti-sigma factor antagonist [Clostridia bacterium]|nr:anti-sigma factor antagonist [Clostridia bacterium]